MVRKRLLRSYLIIHRKTNLKALSQLQHVHVNSIEFEQVQSHELFGVI